MGARRQVLFFLIVLSAGAGCHRQVQPTGGMAPTIKPGERVTTDYLAYTFAPPRRWDVVVMEPPSPILPPKTRHLKRVIALPMETISLTLTGIVVNGTNLSLPISLSNVVYCAPEKLTPAQAKGLIGFPYTVSPNHYFVVGDNWTNSLDSRYYGAVPRTNIFGKVRSK
jgi:signal peptidase I